jgi:GAF domain-containing protein
MASAEWSGMAETLVTVAREINAPRDLDATLQTIVESAARSLPGIDHAGVTVAHSTGEMETKASTDQFVLDLDRLQYELREGPCVHAITHEPVVVIEHAHLDQRWPHFIKPAVERGLRSQLGLRLYTEEKTLGGLNLYSTTRDTVDPEVGHMAQLFAAHAAMAFGRALREENLVSALATRQLIGQATGIIMERHGLDESRAFDYLTRVSSHSNVKIREVAQEIVDAANGERGP